MATLAVTRPLKAPELQPRLLRGVACRAKDRVPVHNRSVSVIFSAASVAACAHLRRVRRVSLTRRRQSAQSQQALQDFDEACELEATRVPGCDRPGNAWELGSRVFSRELGALLLSLRGTGFSELSEWLRRAFKLPELSAKRCPPAVLAGLQLDVDKVAERERERGVPESSPFVKAIFFVLCWTLDRLYDGRPIQKFWVLETVARLPYFSYISVLHLYESLGWWRTPDLRKVHSAEEDNELHHLLVMEALGGDCDWFDRFVAQHAAIAYYWLVVVLFFANPGLAYNFSLLVEEHAHVTYAEFVDANAELLSQVPAPPIAIEYYVSGDLYYFDKFQTHRASESEESSWMPRRPPCRHLLDVFCNIRDDELEHIHTMQALQHWWSGTGPFPLPEDDRPSLGHRKDWIAWSAKINELGRDAQKH